MGLDLEHVYPIVQKLELVGVVWTVFIIVLLVPVHFPHCQPLDMVSHRLSH
jgi:hypothetical protein